MARKSRDHDRNHHPQDKSSNKSRNTIQDKIQGKLQNFFQSAVDAAQKQVDHLAQAYGDADYQSEPRQSNSSKNPESSHRQPHHAAKSEGAKPQQILEPIQEKIVAFDGWAVDVVNEALEQVQEKLSEKVAQAKESTKHKYQDVSRQAEKITKKTLHQVEVPVEKNAANCQGSEARHAQCGGSSE